MLEHLSEAAKEEGDAYARELGLRRPVTVTTVKPSGTISKLFGLTEGAHLPARRAVSALGAVQGHARSR